MRTIRQLGAALLAVSSFVVPSLSAQRVSGDIVIAQGPVAARVEFGDRRYAPVYRRPARVVLVERRYDPYPRPLYVERYHAPRGRAYGWWRRAGYRQVTIWTDADDRYYDRWDDRVIGLHAVIVFERDGRYYRMDRDDDRRFDRDWDDRRPDRDRDWDDDRDD